MRILFIKWNSLGQRDLTEEFERRGWQVDFFDFPRTTENTRLNEGLAEKIIYKLAEGKYDFAFSFNYFPVISIACNACKVKYVSWTFDSPFIQLYSNTINFPYNYVFIFDRGTCADLWRQGIQTVYYLPLAAPVARYDSYVLSARMHELYDTEVSFIGSTYSEKKNRLWDRLSSVSEYTKGYLEGGMLAQKGVYGSFFLEKILKPEILQDMMSACPWEMNQDGFERVEWVYAHYFLARHVTAMERKEILDLLSKEVEVDLYTYEETPELPGVHNKGTAEVMQEASLIYKCSKINLNISLKSILTGIPLRAFDIMGSGGFLMTNYQEDYLEYFVPGEDFVYYEDYADLVRKVNYYLEHEEERAQIARNGYEKVKKHHTYKERVDTMLEVLQGNME